MNFFKRLFGGAPAPAPAPTLPEPSAEPEDAAVVAAALAGPAAGTRVLIIDDSPTIVALLRKFLQQEGYSTLEAYDAEEGVALARAELPDLIFLDIVLPGMNGFAALRLLRREAGTKDIPIVMISGNEQATEQFYAQKIGADDFMKKPFSRAEVFARIERLIRAEKLARANGPQGWPG